MDNKDDIIIDCGFLAFSWILIILSFFLQNGGMFGFGFLISVFLFGLLMKDAT